MQKGKEEKRGNEDGKISKRKEGTGRKRRVKSENKLEKMRGRRNCGGEKKGSRFSSG
jgi:hypothetical protein